MKKITLFLFALFSCWQINAQSIIIGTATTTTTSTGSDPIDGYYESFRYQVVYTAAELSASMTPYDEITALGFSIAGDYAGGSLLGYTIKMGHTTASNSAAHDSSPTVVVKNPFNYNPTVTAAGVFDMITFDTNFVWNGVDNVLVEICSDGPNPYTSPYGQVRANTSVTNGSRFVRADGATSCGVTTTTTNGNKPNIQFNYIEGTPPSCLAPNALAANSITNSSAVLGWNENGTATVWNIQYGVTGFALGSGNIVSGVTNTYSLTGLSSNTQYQYYVQADCGGTQSTWSGPFSFRTLCDALSVPFTETFDSTSSTEACWTVLNVNADADAWNLNYATTPITGNQSANMYTDGNGGNNDDWLISPKITLSGNQRLVFKYKVQSNNEPNDFRVMLSIAGNAPADFSFELQPLASYSNTTPETMVIPLSGISGDVYLGWHIPSGGLDGWRLYIDDVVVEDIPATPPSCVAITSPVTGTADVSSGTITWASEINATGYKISVGTTSGGTDVLNNFDLGNVLTYNLTGLLGGTTYYVTVYPYNDNGVATGCTEINFTTCDVASIPFNEEFETITTGIPSCWGIAGTTTTAGYHFSSYATGNVGRGLRFDSYFNATGRTSELTTPVIDASTVTSLRLNFYYKNPTGGNFEVLISSDGGATYTSLETGLVNTTNWTLKSYVVTSHISSNVKVKFLGTSNWGSGDAYVYLDGVVLEEIPATAPACVTLTSPVNGAVNVSNTTLVWPANPDATGYYITVGTSAGASDVLNNFDAGNVLTYHLSNLVGGTTYYVTISPYNAFGTATGCTESNFTTCDEVGDFVENFDGLAATGLIPDCWSRVLSDGVSTYATVGTSTTNFSAPYSISLYNSSSPSTSNIMLVTPYINNLSAGTNRLRFMARNSSDTQDIIVGTMSNPSDASTFTPLQTVDINGTFAQYIVDFTAYAGTDKYIALKRISTSTYTYVYIDNVIWEAVPATAPACASNVVATPDAACGNFANLITWDATAGADGYYITVGTTTGGTDIANNINLGNVTTYSFSGNFATTYFYTVSPYNAIGTASGCTEASFTTNANGCYCVSGPSSVDGTGITNVLLVSTNFPNSVSTAPVYNDHTATVVDMPRGINNNVQITFDVPSWGTNSYDYNTVIWIDANDNFTFEASEIVYTGLSATTASPTLLNASFVLPGSISLGQHRMRIVATDAEQVPANPCYGGTYGETADFTINVVAPSCAPPVATTSIVNDCANSQYFVNVNVTNLGNGSPVITNGTSTWPVSAVGAQNVGPFAFGAPVNLTILHGTDSLCNLTLGTFNYAGCPPVNDECSNATVLTPGAVFGTNPLVGTNVFATASSGAPAPGCASYSGGDVWYQVTVPASGSITVETNNNSSNITDTGMAVYSGTCGSLTLVECDDDDSGDGNFSLISLSGRTPGEVLLVRVWEYAGGTEDTFQVSAYDASLSAGSFNNSNFLIYPNPVKDMLNISYSSEISYVRVVNMLGQEVISRDINATSTQLDMSHLSAGAYIVTVSSGDVLKTIKVVKQ
ncbi:choice-of-anchor J domain-containing protein [uncultured Flavobacterium sp.]|uniref:T9SS-dependent choice-of-anchor J family protein n=1 Tax=uncultured Flavobacterium sp. TaxID=165435 RepID=UPI002612A446|nr:choice-of-anchor J domain-containing protein [uncultured Flavobacterium sp.]